MQKTLPDDAAVTVVYRDSRAVVENDPSAVYLRNMRHIDQITVMTAAEYLLRQTLSDL